MKRQKHDELDILIQLAVDDGIDEFDEFANLDISNVTFSPSYERRKRKIIRRYKYAPTMATVKRISARVAMFVCLILSVGFITIMSVSSLRNAVIDAVIEWYNDYVSIRFETEALTENIETEPSETEEPWEAVIKARRPREIPEGVEEVVHLDSKMRVLIDYYKNDMLWTSYNQTLNTAQDTYVDNEAVIIDRIDIHGYEAIIFQYVDKEQTVLIWNDGVYVYRLYTYGTTDDLISLAQSIE